MEGMWSRFLTKMCLFLMNADEQSEVAASCLTQGLMLYVGVWRAGTAPLTLAISST